MTTLLNNKGLSKSEMAVAMEMELKHALEEVRNTIDDEKTSSGFNGHSLRLATLRGRESAFVRMLDFMAKNMKKS